MTQLERTRASVVMNINESHYSAIPWDKEGEGSRGVSGGPAQGGDVGATMETQCPVEDRSVRPIGSLPRDGDCQPPAADNTFARSQPANRDESARPPRGVSLGVTTDVVVGCQDGGHDS